MQAALFKPGGKLEVSDRPTPKPGPGEVLVKVAYCGICGSDLHLLDSGFLPPDAILGHELSGHIAGLGPGVEGWAEGEAVVVMPGDPCLVCEPCRNGQTQICQEGLDRAYGLGKNPGAFSQYMLVKPKTLYRIPEGLDLVTAALTEPWAVGRHGVNLLNLTHCSPILVMGAGPIGLMCVYALNSLGISDVVVSEPDPFRAGLAKAAGASLVLDPRAANPAAVIRERTGRLPASVMDCVGSSSSLREAMGFAGPRGLVVVLGLHLGKVSLQPFIGFSKELQIKFSYAYNTLEFGESLTLLARGAVEPKVIISEVLPLREIASAFRLLRETGHSKIILDCQAA